MHPGTLTAICLSGIKIPEALALEAALGRVTFASQIFEYGCRYICDLNPVLKIVHLRNQPEMRLCYSSRTHRTELAIYRLCNSAGFNALSFLIWVSSKVE